MVDKYIDFSTLAKGALDEKLNAALKDVIENLLDPNTDHKTKRKIVVDMKFTTDDTRELAGIEVSTKVSLAPSMPVATKMLIGRDFNTGQIVAKECDNQILGQVEATDVIEKTDANKIVDLRANNK